MEKLIGAGMDVARLNFSHGTHADHLAVMERLRLAQLNARKPVGTLGDLQGPKIRTGKLKDGQVELIEGKQLSITTDESWLGTQDLVSTTYAHLAEDVNPGDRILVDDGLLELKVLTTDKKQLITTQVIHGGLLKNNKGINLPGVALRAAALTPKDREDLIFGLKAGVDMIALSFVRRAEDILECRQAMRDAGRVVPIIAKLEKPEAIERLDEILAVTDGVMVARGDLGVEMPPESVPAIQKEIVRKAAALGLPCIVATQMLNSMIEHPRPTRAEVNDVANAIFDGTDAVMLSGESASGRYPVESVEMMLRIVEASEASIATGPRATPPGPLKQPAEFQDAICNVACHAAQDAGAKPHRHLHPDRHLRPPALALPPADAHRRLQPQPGSAPPHGPHLGRHSPRARAGAGDGGDGQARGVGAAGPGHGEEGRSHRHRLRRARRPRRQHQHPAAAPRRRVAGRLEGVGHACYGCPP